MIDRRDPPVVAEEKEMLVAFLDYHRDTLIGKLEGLDDEQLRRRLVPSETTILGVVKHLAYVERGWFQRTFLVDMTLERGRSEDDPDADWRIGPDESTEAIVDLYRAEVAKGRAIIEAAAFEDLAKRSDRRYTLRWIVAHMIEETARHNGHVDILRELIDGSVGE